MVEVADLLLWCARENIEEVANHLNTTCILRVSLEICLLKLVMSQTVEVVNIAFWLL